MSVLPKPGLSLRFSVLISVLIVVIFTVFTVWNVDTERRRMEAELLETARVLSDEMDAVWDFFEENQEHFEKDENGNYTLYCVLAAKSVSKFFTNDTDYSIHYTNKTTRRDADAPDDFELAAMEAFLGEVPAKEYYGFTEVEGESVFRYSRPLFAGTSCLECHGEPAGELDSFGFPKEGMAYGDVAGAISVTVPAEAGQRQIAANAMTVTAVFAVLVVLIVAVISVGLNRWVVSPLAALRKQTRRVREGTLRIDCASIGRNDEIAQLAGEFQAMGEQLAGLYDDLEARVRDRTGDLARANDLLDAQRQELLAMNEQLASANRFKSDFLASVGHDMRTPLTSIVAYTDLWASSPEGGADEQAIVGEISDCSIILLQMVNNILDAARVDAGQMRLVLELVDPVDVLNRVEASWRLLAKRQGVSLEVSCDGGLPLFEADGDVVHRILDNLVSNAVKFTPAGGRVRVSAHADGDCLRFDVADSGSGLTKEEQAAVFERFQRTPDAVSRHIKGTGLGLSLVRELVGLHGGTVGVRSRKGEGSTFSVRLPLRAASKGDGPAASAKDGGDAAAGATDAGTASGAGATPAALRAGRTETGCETEGEGMAS